MNVEVENDIKLKFDFIFGIGLFIRKYSGFKFIKTLHEF